MTAIVSYSLQRVIHQLQSTSSRNGVDRRAERNSATCRYKFIFINNLKT